MLLIHKFFKFQSLVPPSSEYLFISSSCVFISAKVNYCPVSLERVVAATYSLERRLNTTQVMRPTLSQDRETHYRNLIEKLEFEILVSTGFDLEFELPYKYLRIFCERHVSVANRENLFLISVRFCNDSFKLPLSLYYHPKVIAAACM